MSALCERHRAPVGMNELVRMQLDAVDWASLRVMGERDEAWIPTAVERLVTAETEEEAQKAYRRLDNTVVVQGQLFEAALPLVPVLLAALAGELPAPARVEVADLLQQIAAGWADRSEVALGNEQLGDACRAATGEGIWLIYGMLLDEEPWSRCLGLWIIRAADPNRDRAERTIRHFAQNDPDQTVRENAETALEPFDPGAPC